MNIHSSFTYCQLYANTFNRYLYLIYTNSIGACFTFEVYLIKINRKIDTYSFQSIYFLIYRFEVLGFFLFFSFLELIRVCLLLCVN